MKILLASSEVHPYSKTGGLADMVGSLGKALARAGHRVGIVTPLYMGIRERVPGLRQSSLPLDFPLGLRRVFGEVWESEIEPRLTIYFVDQPEFYQRSTLYQKYGADYDDNAERFIFLSKAAAHLALHLPWKPEILHAHDWQTGFVPLFLHHQRQLPGWHDAPRTCFTVHNLAYQGVFPAGHYALANLPWDYFHPGGVEFHQQTSCLKAGLAFSDLLTTVSPRYAEEITTEEYGCGLDGLLRHRRDALHGVLNGVDYDEWNTTKNPHIPHPYSLNDLNGKAANKANLQREFGLPIDPTLPLFGNIGRLAEQKGVDIMIGALASMLQADMQFVSLGTGSPVFERALQELGEKFPTKAAVRIGFDQALSHRIEAGSDFFVMPSRFEPCGLNQMYSLRYGTIPIVRRTGGLDNTVVDLRENAELADGIKFESYSSSALAKAIHKALVLYREPGLLQHFRRNGMSADFSWDRTAGEFERMYRELKI
jgi:starch synthase